VQLVKKIEDATRFFVHFDVYNLQNELATGVTVYYEKAGGCTTG